MAEIYQHFGTASCLNSSTLKRETECSYETSANIHKLHDVTSHKTLGESSPLCLV